MKPFFIYMDWKFGSNTLKKKEEAHRYTFHVLDY